MEFRNFIFSPLLSLFSRKFYRQMSQSSLGRGFLYFLYLDLLFSLALSIGFSFVAFPTVDRGMEWLAVSMPPINFTKEGAATSVQQPFLLKHPRFGPLLIVDTTLDEASPAEVRKSYFYLTKVKIYAWNPDGQNYRFVDIRPNGEEWLRQWRDIHVDEVFIRKLYKAYRPFIPPTVFVIAFLLFLIYKSGAAFLYSLPAFLINLFRKQRLAYDQLLNLCIFALTPVAFLQVIKILWMEFPLEITFWSALLITCAYLAFAILATQEKPENSGVAGHQK